jgi:MFS family permease
VGLVGFAALVPLVVFGLYGGAIADAVDRRKLLFVTSAVMMAASVTLLAQAVAGLDSLGVLFACVVVQAAAPRVIVNTPPSGWMHPPGWRSSRRWFRPPG